MTDLPLRVWRKSSRSGENGNSCVELAIDGDGLAVRDSKNPDGGVLILGGQAREAFMNAVRKGRLSG